MVRRSSENWKASRYSITNGLSILLNKRRDISIIYKPAENRLSPLGKPIARNTLHWSQVTADTQEEKCFHPQPAAMKNQGTVKRLFCLLRWLSRQINYKKHERSCCNSMLSYWLLLISFIIGGTFPRQLLHEPTSPKNWTAQNPTWYTTYRFPFLDWL